MVEKFEVGKKYQHHPLGGVCICTVITPYGTPVVQFLSTKSESLIYPHLKPYYSEYVEPPLAVGDTVKWCTQCTPSKIKAISENLAWIMNLNTQQDYIVPLEDLKRV